MTEKSYLWLTGHGDGTTPIDEDGWGDIFNSLCNDGLDVNSFEATVSSDKLSVTIGTGGALINGRPYFSSEKKSISIAPTSSGSNYRFDVIALRLDRTAKTIRTIHLSGVEAVSPALPELTKTADLYEVWVCGVMVSSTGIAYLDNPVDKQAVRSFGNSAFNNSQIDSSLLGINLDSINSAFPANYVPGTYLANSAITTAKIANGSVIAAKISPINGDRIKDAQITSEKIANSTITVTKIANASITTAKLQSQNITPASLAAVSGTADRIKPGSIENAKVNFTAIPMGGIVMWHGDATTVPAGWLVCDGTNGTPDLRNKFVMGVDGTHAYLSTGGSESVSLTHTHANVSISSEASHKHKLSSVYMNDFDSEHAHAIIGDPFYYDGMAGTIVLDKHPSGSSKHGHAISASSLTSAGTAHTHTLNIQSASVQDGIDTRPPYFALVYMIKNF